MRNQGTETTKTKAEISWQLC